VHIYFFSSYTPVWFLEILKERSLFEIPALEEKNRGDGVKELHFAIDPTAQKTVILGFFILL